VDPERQWIARLEPETPEQREGERDGSPRSRVPRLVAGGIVAACGGLELIGFLDEDPAILRPAAIVVAGLVALTVGLLERRRPGRQPLEASKASEL
jgi:hypothetical protein